MPQENSTDHQGITKMLLEMMKSSLLSHHDLDELMYKFSSGNVHQLVSEHKDIVDEFVEVWSFSNENVYIHFIIWVISVHSFLIHGSPLEIHASILKVLIKTHSKDLDGLRHNVKLLFNSPTSSCQMMEYCNNLYSHEKAPSWFLILNGSSELQAKMHEAFGQLYDFSVHHLRNDRDIQQLIHVSLRLCQYLTAQEFLEEYVRTISPHQVIDLAYCQLWYSSIIYESFRNNGIDVSRPAFHEMEFFVTNVLSIEDGLLKLLQPRYKIVNVPQNLWHLFEDSMVPHRFVISEKSIPKSSIEKMVEHLHQSASLFLKSGHLTLSHQIYQRLIEYYSQLPNSENVLQILQSEVSLLNSKKTLGTECLFKYCRYYLVSVLNKSENKAIPMSEEYIYRVYPFENIEIFIEKRILKDFPLHQVITAKNIQYSANTVRILPALEDRSNTFVVYDYLQEHDIVFPEDDKIFGVSKKLCFVGNISLFTRHEQPSFFIDRAKVIRSTFVFDEANQMDANCIYLGYIQNMIKNSCQALAQNIVNGVSLSTCTVCKELFELVGCLLYDILEGSTLLHVLGIQQCKHLIYNYRAIYKDELASRKREIRRKWMKESKIAQESKQEIPPEPSLSNLLEHNAEYLKLRSRYSSFLEMLNHAFIFFKEAAESVYHKHEDMFLQLQKLQLARLQTINLLSELSITDDQT
ncbi:hypothetical protein C9374_013401 [Naegleria lovaniensis]|uniref:Uncharacterized protein n=1 Tax=Naegleria lovaniensis TaxID=51637 RepID=A0AA88H2L1_NAELO|nr:uncharacterized protein C9374_013401 [Naegleria lovaniensis]KAG2391916.1 hypothetical protein C9374_013401 [Naegleria lovaniensis]